MRQKDIVRPLHFLRRIFWKNSFRYLRAQTYQVFQRWTTFNTWLLNMQMILILAEKNSRFSNHESLQLDILKSQFITLMENLQQQQSGISIDWIKNYVCHRECSLERELLTSFKSSLISWRSIMRLFFSLMGLLFHLQWIWIHLYF